jgi:putative ABC transport system permease protein
MSFIEVALCNLRRNPVRSLLTGLSLAVSAATLTLVLSLDKGYSTAVTQELVHSTGVHLYVTKEGCPIEAASVVAHGGLSPVYVDEDIVAGLGALPEVDAVMPFKLFSLTAEDGARTDIFMGITDAVERVKPDWRYASGGWFEGMDSVILGAELARMQHARVGSPIHLDFFDRTFEVAGILHPTYGQEDSTFFLPLATAQQLVGREGKLSAVAVKLADITAMDVVRNRILASMPADYFVIGSRELSDGILRFFSATRAIMFVMVGVAFLLSVIGVVNTMLMAVLERRREMAYLKCIGAGRYDLFRLISLETLAIALMGSGLGALLGMALSPVSGKLMRTMLVAYVPTGPIARPDPGIALMAFGLCTLVGLICSLYPAFRAARIVPMEVLRNE